MNFLTSAWRVVYVIIIAFALTITQGWRLLHCSERSFSHYQTKPWLNQKTTLVLQEDFGEYELSEYTLAIITGNISDLVTKKLKSCADINAIDESGCTLLMYVVMAANSEAVNTLLSHGADVTIKDKDGCTALSYAKGIGNEQVLQTLIAAESYSTSAFTVLCDTNDHDSATIYSDTDEGD